MASVRKKHLAPAALVLLGAAVLWLSTVGAQPAYAAPCPLPTYGIDTGGNLAIQGTGPCAEAPEVIAPYCTGGTIRFDYEVNGVLQGTVDTAVACGAPTHISVFGNPGDDTLELSRVGAASGFTGITQPNFVDGGSGKDTLIGSPTANTVYGGPQNDIVLVRNGLGDFVDCGDGIDAVQADQLGVDSIAGCEVVDLAASAVAPAPVAGRSGRRAAALKRCRKKHGKARRRCIRHAKKLPARPARGV